MKLTLVPYSTVGAGIAVNGQFGTVPGTVTLDWEAAWTAAAQGLPFPPIDTLMKEGFAIYEATCGILFIRVEDSGEPLAVSPKPDVGPVMRFCVAPAGPAVDFLSDTNLGGPGAWGSSCWNSNVQSPPTTYMSEMLGSNWVPRIMAHELSHSLLNKTDSYLDATSVYYPLVYELTTVPIMNASDIADAQAVYGAPQTSSALVGMGALLGEIYSAYMGSRNAAPDNAGLVFWHNLISAKPELFATLCADLVGTGPATEANVTQYYQNCLGRVPDAAGLAFWLKFNAAQVLHGVATSVEAGSLRAAQFTSGLWFS